GSRDKLKFVENRNAALPTGNAASVSRYSSHRLSLKGRWFPTPFLRLSRLRRFGSRVPLRFSSPVRPGRSRDGGGDGQSLFPDCPLPRRRRRRGGVGGSRRSLPRPSPVPPPARRHPSVYGGPLRPPGELPSDHSPRWGSPSRTHSQIGRAHV